MSTADSGPLAEARLGLSVRSRATMAQLADVPSDVLTELERLGVRSLEVTLPASPEDDEFFAFIPDLLARGFEVSFHTPYPDALDLQGFVDGQDPVGDYYRVWLSALGRLPLRPERPVLVVHGVNAPGTGPEVGRRARETSVAFLRWLGAELVRQQVRLWPAFEVRPGREGWTKVGSTCSEVLAVVEEAGGPQPGICWDVGHSMMNLARGDDAWPPPEAFIGDTVHCHLHLATAERDHLTISSPAPLLREALALLAGVGYGGVLNLECAFHCWEEVVGSVEVTRRVWQDVCDRG